MREAGGSEIELLATRTWPSMHAVCTVVFV